MTPRLPGAMPLPPGGGTPATATIRGVILDFGGVLWNLRLDVARELEQAHRLPDGALFETFYRTTTWADIRCGRGDREAWLEEAHRLLEAKAGRSLQRLHAAWRACQHPIAENVAILRALHRRYRTAVLSNADLSLRERIRERLGIHDLLDAIVCSAEVGIAKPDPAIYHLAAEQLGLVPESCVFVDDEGPNVAGAREVGMHPVLFRLDRDDDLLSQLTRLGVRIPS